VLGHTIIYHFWKKALSENEKAVNTFSIPDKNFSKNGFVNVCP